MKINRFYFFLLMFAIYSCRPEELPPDETQNPVFSVSGAALDIAAGEGDFYLFSEYEKDEQDVYSFIARFAKLSTCVSDCDEELVIEIRDAQQVSGSGGVDIDLALHPGNYPYRLMNPSTTNDLVTLSLSADPEGTGPFNYLWTIGDSLNFTTADVANTFENYQNIPSVNVCLSVDNNIDCQMEYCNVILLNNNTPGCQADFSVISGPLLIQLEANMINGTPPYAYQWNNNSSGQVVSISNNGTINETYCVTITDAQGCTDAICKEISLVQGTTFATVCASRFSYDKTIEPGSVDSLQLSTVLIRYTDPNGVEYRSDFQQAPGSAFVIHSVEGYEPNENGLKTKKLAISGNCRLYSGNGTSIQFPFEGVIAVAYP